MNRKIMKAEATYDFLKDEVHCLYEEKEELQQRINKAIEYIEKYGEECGNGEQYFTTSTPINYLLDTLKGEEK